MRMAIGHHGEITLPEGLRSRYGLNPGTSVRIVETRAGVLIVPLLNSPMSDELIRGLSIWQSLGEDSLEMFAYETAGP